MPSEWKFINAQHTLFTYLHLASSKELTMALINSNCKAISYETVTNKDGRHILLEPMSAIAGRLAAYQAAMLSLNPGPGCLIGGLTGINSQNITILGAGCAGTNACTIALGMGANVTIVDNDINKLHDIEKTHKNIKTLYFSKNNMDWVKKILMLS